VTSVDQPKTIEALSREVLPALREIDRRH
jgi:hypothetical protein